MYLRKRKLIVRVAMVVAILSVAIYRLYGYWDDARQVPFLLAAARSGDRIGVLSALEAGAPSDAHDSEGRTALMLAAERGDIDSARSLLDSGATANRSDAHGDTVLMRAVTSDNPALVALILFWR